MDVLVDATTTIKHRSENYFARREWSCTLPGEIYIRYLSFADRQGLANYVKGLAQKPEKLDIGAVFSVPVCCLTHGLCVSVCKC
jgi:DNA primase catalytic subunit